MANTTRVSITSPVGRIVEGNLYKPNTTDFDGKPLVTKTGANVGQPRSDFYFAIAIPKIPGHTHWAQTDWGQKILQVGAAAFPTMYQSPSFAWKIIDGDSAIPNKRGTLPKDKEGFPGNWIIRFSGGIAPKIYRPDANGGWAQAIEADYIKPGYFVQVAFNVDGNENQNNPGIYINHSMVCFRAYGEEINFGPNVNEAGFGQAPLPAGASAIPLAGAIPLPGAAPLPTVPAIGVTAATLPLPIAGVPVVPQPQFLQVPVPAAGVPSVPVGIAAASAMIPSPSSGPQMTAKAGSVTREQFIAQGWTDANLIAHGYMTP